MERIELPQADLEAAVLPLYYTGIKLAPQVRIERTTSSLTVKRNYRCATGEYTWWVARDSNPVAQRATDLQSAEVTNASRYPRKF